jgi:hypothetical protein
VSDGAVEQYPSVTADAEGESGMEAALVEAACRLPDAVAGIGLDAQLPRRRLRLPPNAGDGVEIGPDAGAR